MKIDRTNPIVVRLRGSRFECGQQLGRAVGHLFRDELRMNRRFLEDWTTLGWIQESYRITERELPIVMEEVRGVAAGTGITPLEAFALYCFEELSDFSDGCTDMVASGKATANGHTLVGHTNDEPAVRLPNVLIVQETPSDPVVTGFSMRGRGFDAAVNDAGLVLTGNHLTQRDIKRGIPRFLIMGEIIRQRTLEEAFKVAAHPARASSYNHVVTVDGRSWSLEGSANQMARFRVEGDGGAFAHTNHYLAVPDQESKDPEGMERSKRRLAYANRELIKGYGHHTTDTFREILSHPPVCRHDDASPTCFTLVFDVTDRIGFYAPGPACQTPWVKFKF